MIIRVRKNQNYSVISNVHLLDGRLSWKAKGLLTYLLSKPDDWEVRPEHLAGASKDGIKAVYSGIKELKQFGYLEMTSTRDEKKRVVSWEYVVVENPQIPESIESDLLPQKGKVGFGQVENVHVGNRHLLNTDSNQVLNRPNTEKTAAAPLPPGDSQDSETPPPFSSEDIPAGLADLLALLPGPPSERIKNKIALHLKRRGYDYVRDHILYANDRNKDRRTYDGFLGRALEEEWATGYGADRECQLQEDQDQAEQERIRKEQEAEKQRAELEKEKRITDFKNGLSENELAQMRDEFEAGIKAGNNPIIRKAFRKALFEAETREYDNLTINVWFNDYLAGQAGKGCPMQQEILKSKNERGDEDGRVSRRIET